MDTQVISIDEIRQQKTRLVSRKRMTPNELGRGLSSTPPGTSIPQAHSTFYQLSTIETVEQHATLTSDTFHCQEGLGKFSPKQLRTQQPHDDPSCTMDGRSRSHHWEEMGLVLVASRHSCFSEGISRGQEVTHEESISLCHSVISVGPKAPGTVVRVKEPLCGLYSVTTTVLTHPKVSATPGGRELFLFPLYSWRNRGTGVLCKVL